MNRRIYLDLDGVMADFDGTFPTVFGLDHRDIADDDMWIKINSHPSFFRDLPPMNGAVEFFRTIEHLDPIILTACPKSNYAHVATQKVEWVRAHLSAHVTVLPVLGGSSKPLFMHAKGDILIDDFRRNTEAWANAGGHAILHRGFDGTASVLEEAIGPYAPKLAQPVEAVDVTDQMVHDALYARAAEWSVIQLFQDAEEAPDIMRIALRSGLRAILAHPRPTGDDIAHLARRVVSWMDTAGYSDSALPGDMGKDVRAMRDALGNRGYAAPTGAGCPCEPSRSDGLRCPGADGKLLCDPASSAPTGEQAGEVVAHRLYSVDIGTNGKGLWGEGDSELTDAEISDRGFVIQRAYAQPRSMGVPDDLADDAARWRFVRELAWFVDTARYVYDVKDAKGPFASWHSWPSPDWDEIQGEIDKVRLAAATAPGKGGEA